MNLTNLFNFNYLKQNLKKSKVVLSIFIGLIPILNTIILAMILTNDKSHIISFSEISALTLIGTYFLPIIISICLFNYIYKKQSVDFINSMPIKRKSIFVTNTILGISIITIMLLFNAVLAWIVCQIFNSPITFMMILDYFWFFLIVYIFIFSATNLAMTISGNAITQIIVTLLLLFLIPFSHLYLKDTYYSSVYMEYKIECNDISCKPDKYYCYDDKECLKNLKQNRYDFYPLPVVHNNYTTPFGILAGSFYSNNYLINNPSIIKMIILSIIYNILGFILFLKRKMEVSETTFKNIHIHNLVKSLTLIPIATIAYGILKHQQTIFIIFVVIILLIYYFIYDLITKKNIQNIKLSCLYFLVTIFAITMTLSLLDNEKNEITILKPSDITEVSLLISNYSGISYDSKKYIANEELKNLVVKSMLNNQSEDTNKYINAYIKTKDNKEYEVGLNVNKEEYNKIISLLEKEEEYLNFYKNINIDEVYAVKIGNLVYSKKEAEPLLQLIQKTLQNLSLKQLVELQDKYSYIDDHYYINLYTYENHDRQTFAVNSYINYELLNAVVNSNNKALTDVITPIIPKNLHISYENAYLTGDYNINYYVVRSAGDELYEFILNNQEEKVDMHKEFITLSVMLNYNTYHFTTNKVNEIQKILDKKFEEIKNTEDYNDYYGYDEYEDIEYYD